MGEQKLKVYLGIDIGKQGAICGIVENGEVLTSSIPLIGDEISLVGIAKILDVYLDCYQIAGCGIEDVHSIFGASAKSNFQFGRSLGIIEGILSSKKVPFVKVFPKTWQKLAFFGVPELKKAPTTEQIAQAAKKQQPPKGSPDTKAMALVAAERLFPGVSLLASPKSKKPHEGIVDALLIAYFVKKT